MRDLSRLKFALARIPAACVVAAMALFCALPAAAQEDKKAEAAQKEKKEKTVVDWKPAVLPADALAFAAKMDEIVWPEAKRWADGYAKKEMRERAVNPQATMGVVDQRYPQASDAARDAGTFLLFYLAYKDEDEFQRMTAFRIRDIDRETKEITRELQVIWKNEQNRSASLRPLGQAEQLAQEQQVRGMESKLREYGDERQMKLAQLDASRKKVNVYLKLLDKVYSTSMRGTDPAIIRELK